MFIIKHSFILSFSFSLFTSHPSWFAKYSTSHTTSHRWLHLHDCCAHLVTFLKQPCHKLNNHTAWPQMNDAALQQKEQHLQHYISTSTMYSPCYSSRSRITACKADLARPSTSHCVSGTLSAMQGKQIVRKSRSTFVPLHTFYDSSATWSCCEILHLRVVRSTRELSLFSDLNLEWGQSLAPAHD